MPWTISEDLDEFAAAAGPLLRDRPAQNTLPLTITETLRTTGLQSFGAQPPVFGWWQPRGGRVETACLQTPPFPLLLTSGPPQAFAELAATLAEGGRTLPGVNASEPVAAQFAAQWGQRTGAVATVYQRHRLYRLGELLPPRPGPPGHARTATTSDHDLVAVWVRAFHDEAGGLVERSAEEEAHVVTRMIERGGLSLWETGGAPVSMAGLSRQVAGMTRVGPVYTPPALRRRGYAAAVTAAVTRAALDGGAAEVLLFTDLANPTSNSLYQRLGYQPAEDRVLMSFSPPGSNPGP